MKTIKVTASKSYDVLVGTDILDEAGFMIRKTVDGQSAAIITDDTVADLYGKRLINSLEKNGYRTFQYVFPHGEASKNPETFLSIIDFLASEKLSRTDIVIALGGGVTGDIAGFAAASYLRGIRFIQIPTTVLSAVDSSVGGKTAVNLTAGKNLLGAFYQPDLVLCDISLLSTLSDEVFRDGCAEIIKYGMISDRVFYESIKEPVKKHAAGTHITPPHLEDVICRCVEIKRDIVTEDEFESGVRKLLNFGHTLGHAIELLSGYRISHGHAIAAGMVIETRAAVRMGICKADCLQSITDILSRYGLPVSTEYNAQELTRVCISDKKIDGSKITMVFPEKTGKCILKEIPVCDIESVIQSGLEEDT